MPVVTVKHTFVLKDVAGRGMLYVWAEVQAANGEQVKASDLGLKTVFDAEVTSLNPNINAGLSVANPGSYGNYVTVYGSDVSGSVAVAAGTFTSVLKALGI